MSDPTPEQAARKACPLCKGIGAGVDVDAIHPDGRVENPRPAVCMVCDGEGTVDVDAPNANAPTPQRAMILSAYYDQTTALCDLIYGTDGDALDGAAEVHAELNAALANAYEDGKGNVIELLDAERTARQEAERERDNHARTLYAEGYTPCATAECNCGGWHGGHVAELRARLRNVAQTLIAEVGAGGPMNAEAAAERAVALILGLREERDEARADMAAVQARYTRAWETLCDIGEALDAAGYPQLVPERALRVGDGVTAVLRDLAEARAEADRLRAFVPVWRWMDNGKTCRLWSMGIVVAMLFVKDEGVRWTNNRGDEGQEPDLPTAARAVYARLGIASVEVPDP